VQAIESMSTSTTTPVGDGTAPPTDNSGPARLPENFPSSETEQSHRLCPVRWLLRHFDLAYQGDPRGFVFTAATNPRSPTSARCLHGYAPTPASGCSPAPWCPTRPLDVLGGIVPKRLLIDPGTGAAEPPLGRSRRSLVGGVVAHLHGRHFDGSSS
jgi:hypothetical protein